MVQALKRLAVGLQRVKACAQGYEKEHANQQENVIGDGPVDDDNPLPGFLLRLVVQVQQLRNNTGNRLVLALQLRPNQVARRILVALVRQVESFVGKLPEVVEDIAQLLPQLIAGRTRSEERRVGKECRSRW